MNDEEARIELIAEQLRHAVSLLKAELAALREQQTYTLQLVNQRLSQLERRADDQELRLRAASDGVTSFKVWSGLASGGSFLAALGALLKSFLSPP
jgi:hypothetical protein